MRHLILLVAACHVASAGDLLTVQPAVVQYDVVPHRPALYSAPAVHVTSPLVHAQSHLNTPYVGTYAVHTTPAIHHNYHHTQTHPIGYVKPVHVYGGSGVYGGNSQYYQPTATSHVHQSRVIVPATSTVHQSHLVVPATNRVFQYRAYDNSYNQPYTDGQSSYTANAYGNYGNGGQQSNNNQNYGQANVGYDSNANNGGQVKTRRYQIRRPAIKKEFYDIEEKVIIRPAGSALIELDSPISKILKQDSYAPAYNGQNQHNAGQAYNPNQNQYNAGQAYTPSHNQAYYPNQNQYNAGQAYTPSHNQAYYPNQYQHNAGQAYTPGHNQAYNPNQNQYHAGQGYNQNQGSYTGGQAYNPSQSHFNAGQSNPRGINCDQNGHGANQYQPTTTYLTPTTVTYQPTTYSTPGQYFPTTTYAPTPNAYASSTPQPQPPSRTYQPPYNDQSSNQYHPTTFAPTAESSTPRQTITPSTGNQDIFVSSTTPISVTIVDTAAESKNNNTQSQDIIYARGQSNYGNNQYNGNDENGPDQFRNELPPRGDVSQTADYRETDQFYHELPRSRYTGPYQPPAVHVETKYNGEPTERNYYAEEITIGNRGLNSTGNRNNSTDQQQRLIELYTGNGGVTEIGQTGDQQHQQQQQQQPANGARYTNDGSSSYNDVGNVRARVISATPAPEGSQPSEHVNTRRIVVSKRVETVREVEEPENNGTAASNNGNSNGQNANYNANYNDNSDNGQGRNNDYNANYNNDGRNANNDNYNSANYNDGRSSSNYENSAEYNNNNNNNNQENNANGRANDSSQRYSTPSTPNGYYISTTPASSGKRVIYVKPVTQEFAEQKAVAPSQSSSGSQRRL